MGAHDGEGLRLGLFRVEGGLVCGGGQQRRSQPDKRSDLEEKFFFVTNNAAQRSVSQIYLKSMLQHSCIHLVPQLSPLTHLTDLPQSETNQW